LEWGGRRQTTIVTVAISFLLVIAGLAGCGDGAPATAQPSGSSAELRAFTEFPVLWLGESYDSDGDGTGDMDLNVHGPAQSPPFNHPLTGELIRPSERSYGISYGSCDIPVGADSCPIPITIEFYPPDTGSLSDSVKTGEKVLVRGIVATVYSDGHLWVETADVTFAILAVNGPRDGWLDSAIRVLSLLEGANAPASHITQGSLLRPKPRVFPTATAPGASPPPMNTPTPAGSPSATPASAPTTEPDSQAEIWNLIGKDKVDQAFERSRIDQEY
jgi:hypothetical protein